MVTRQFFEEPYTQSYTEIKMPLKTLSLNRERVASPTMGMSAPQKSIRVLAEASGPEARRQPHTTAQHRMHDQNLQQ